MKATNPDERVISLDRSKLSISVVICYLIALFLAWLARDFLTGRTDDMIGVAPIIILLAGSVILGIDFTVRLLDRRPAIILNPDGLWYNLGGDARLIPWPDIRGFRLTGGDAPRHLWVNIGDAPHNESVDIMMPWLEISIDPIYEDCLRYHAKYGASGARKLDERTIPLHRLKLIGGTFLAYTLLAAAVVSLHIVSSTGGAAFAPWRPYLAILLLIVLFDLLGVGALTRLLDRRPGLILSPDGILDNSGPFAVGFIPWSDIAALDFHETKKGGAVIVKVTDPERYLRSGGLPARIYRRTRNRRLGSPIVITPNCLRIGFPELKAECARFYHKYGAKPAPAGQSAKVKPAPAPNKAGRYPTEGSRPAG